MAKDKAEVDETVVKEPAVEPQPAYIPAANPVACALREVVSALRIHGDSNDQATKQAFSAMAERLETRAKALEG